MKSRKIRKSVSLPTALAGPVNLKVSGNSVHLRSGPGTTYPSYGFLYNGDPFTGYDEGYGFTSGEPGPMTALAKAYGGYIYGWVSNLYLVNG